MDRDLVIGVTGAVLLVVAMIGVFAYESGRAADTPGTYAIGFVTADDALAGATGTATEGECTPVTFVIPGTNVTQVTFTLTWTDDVGDPDTFNVTVRGPAGVRVGSREAANGAGGGTIAVPIHVANVPAPFAVDASSEEEARRIAASNTTLRAGSGTWTADVCLVDAPGTNAPVAGLPPIEEDGSNGFRWAATFTAYSATVTGPGE